MPGISVLGDFAYKSKRHASAALPAEARALSRTIRNLDDLPLGTVLLRGVAEAALLAKINEFLPFFAGDDYGDVRIMEHRLALLVEQAIQTMVDEAAAAAGDRDASNSDSHVPAATEPTSTEAAAETTAALVSDMSSAEETPAPSLRQIGKHHKGTVANVTSKAIWARLLESLHLAVCTRTTKLWGRKKIYEVYRLGGGPVRVQGKSCHEIANIVNEEFRNIFHGGGEENSGCRVYCQEHESRIYLQVCIGKPYDYTDMRNRSITGEKKKKKANEFVIICEEGSDLMAVTASRAPSGSRFTHYVLATLEIVLSGGAKPQQTAIESITTARVGDWSGTEPLDLLMAAHATGIAEGRFDHFAKTDTVQDPVVELQNVATASLMGRASEAQRLQFGEKHGRAIAAAMQCSKDTGAAMVAINSKGTMLDHSEDLVQEWKRQRLNNLGDTTRVPFPQMAWQWTGTSSVPSECWDPNIGCAEVSVIGMAMQGADVMAGFRHMMDMGLSWGNDLPDYIRDANGSVITVRHGVFSASV